MFIKTKISVGIHDYVVQYNNVKALHKIIDEQFKTSKKVLGDEQFKTSNKAVVNTLVMKFSLGRLNCVRDVREHIMKMQDVTVQLNIFEVEIFETFLCIIN